MNNHTTTLWIFLLVFIFGGVAGAKDVPVRLTQSTVVQHHTDNKNGQENDDDYTALVNRLNLSAALGGLTTGARVDATRFWDSPTDWHRDEARLERMFVRYKLGDWTLTVGDFYRQLGRGIVLALRKVDEAGVDIGLRGGEASLVTQQHRFGVFTGRTNIVNIDQFKQRFVRDPDDILAGGWYAWRGLKWLEVGAHYLYRQNHTPITQSELPDASNHVGLTLEFPALGEFGSLYLEADYQQQREVDEVTDGKAAYGALDVFVGDTTLLLEGIYLDNIQQLGSVNAYGERVRYNLAPTLERIDQETSRGQNEWGGRLRIEHALLDGDFVIYANGLYKSIDPGKAAEVGLIHGFAGTELQYQMGRSRATLSGGWRDEKNTSGEESVNIKSMYHGELDLLQYVTNGYAIQLAANYEFRTQAGEDATDGQETEEMMEDDEMAEAEALDASSDKETIRGSAFIGIQKSGLGTLTFEQGFDNSDPRSTIRNKFYAGIISWDAADWLKVRATVGTQRGGLKCIAGVCRVYPSFSGYHLELIGQHDLGG